MRALIAPESRLSGDVRVPGDKSIGHRWLMLAATAGGRSRLVSVPLSLDVRSTAACMAKLSPGARPALDVWSSNDGLAVEDSRSTWNDVERSLLDATLEVEGQGRQGLAAPHGSLDCGNSGTTMRLLAGVLASAPFRSVLTGDESLARRPMERVAEPLRTMGAGVETVDGHAPITVDGGALRGIEYIVPVASAQLKSAVLLAAAAADGPTTLTEPAATRDHTERALAALGAPITSHDRTVVLGHGFQHAGFEGRVPGDLSGAAFLIAAAAVTRSEITIQAVGLNPTRTRFLEVLRRMGVRTETRIERVEVGEPVGDIWVAADTELVATTVTREELPLVVDEVPVLASVAALAPGETRFVGGGELRVKESDRLTAMARGIRGLRGSAYDDGDELVVAGGGLGGGFGEAGGDHRIAMALSVAALGATGSSEIDGMESAAVSFPGFVETLAAVGARVEAV